MKRSVALIGCILALAFPASASAYCTNVYQGWIKNHYDANCLWYPFFGACSGWNYWVKNDLVIGPVHGVTLQGFENNQRIRGRERYIDGHYILAPSDVSMSGYLKADWVWWLDGDTYGLLTACS